MRDICTLIDDCFADERYHLLSVCGMVNTHNAAGRMLLLNLANYNQFEREMIPERTREAMQHMKAQGIKLGTAPYGYEHAKHVDDKGRRVPVPLASEQAVIGRIAVLHGEGVEFAEIAQRLNADHVPARQGGDWCGRVLSVILQREGKYIVRPHKEYAPRVPLVHDKATAAARARELKSQELSLRAIGVRLRKEGEERARPRRAMWKAKGATKGETNVLVGQAPAKRPSRDGSSAPPIGYVMYL